ncbi:MAG: sugar transferase [Verrucomicrobiota bacterium]|jgi:exopolysaccharide biosynthesis polyprenyl glycosylphosphotransferase
MLRRQKEIHARIQMVVDALLCGLGFYLAHAVRSHWESGFFTSHQEILPFGEYRWLLLIILPGAPLLLYFNGVYEQPLPSSRRGSLWKLSRACVWMVLGVIFTLWVMRVGVSIARSVIIYFGFISFVLVALKEELLLRWRRSVWGQRQFEKRLLLVGTPEDTLRLRNELKDAQRDDLKVVAQLALNEEPVQRLVQLLHEHSANGVILVSQHIYFGQIEQAIEVCEREGVEVWLIADFFKTQLSRTRVDEFYGRPMLVFSTGPEHSWPILLKQVLDFVGSSLLLAFLAVPLLLVALAVRLTSPGPVFFRQQRSGLNGRPFTMLKFRSMVSDAEQLKHELAALNEMTGPVFKVTNDPRITPFGRFLRRYSIDELPQLMNVWRGEMSLVGPRPLPVDEVKRFDDLAHRRRLSVKPGLTCLWQISGRNNVCDFKEWVRLDLEYIDHWSLWLDLQILCRTIPAVFSGAGAR